MSTQFIFHLPLFKSIAQKYIFLVWKIIRWGSICSPWTPPPLIYAYFHYPYKMLLFYHHSTVSIFVLPVLEGQMGNKRVPLTNWCSVYPQIKLSLTSPNFLFYDKNYLSPSLPLPLSLSLSLSSNAVQWDKRRKLLMNALNSDLQLIYQWTFSSFLADRQTDRQLWFSLLDQQINVIQGGGRCLFPGPQAT